MMGTTWLQADWPAPDFIKAGTTSRQGGASRGAYDGFNLASHVGDDIVLVEENRRSLLQWLNLAKEPQWLEQTHSTQVILLPNKENTPIADASYTLDKNTVCAVMTADCLPLLITNRQGNCVAAIHAGWRGLCDGIIEATIKKLSIAPESLLVWLGPAIGADSYEIGEEVYNAFTQDNDEAKQAFTATSDKHWLFDIYRIARLRLRKMGVNEVYGGDHCTLSENEYFFSYRRNDVTGRMASMIWIEQHTN